MRVLLSTIGSRGDVQPLVALGLQLKALGQEVHLCVPPDFREWIEELGIGVTPIGPELRKMTTAAPTAATPFSPALRRQMAEASVSTQFHTIAEAARGCDLIVGATALQIAAPSVAERMGIPYVFAVYSPTVLPSRHHAPPFLPPLPGDPPVSAETDNLELWARDAERFNDLFGSALNAHRTAAGLGPVSDVRTYVFTNRPWLAADPTLGPWPELSDANVFQTGAWILPDERPLAPELRTYLEHGEPPIYFGFGSARPPQGVDPVLLRLQAARALGRRAIVSRGWADLSWVEHEPDCLAIGDTNLQALFTQVAAVVHHAGAGTTTLAALAGVPQVAIPQAYDQYYWASRIGELGIGIGHSSGPLTVESLTSALDHALGSDVAARARSVAAAVRLDGTEIAARRLIAGGRHHATDAVVSPSF